jgi:hypothetical protein
VPQPSIVDAETYELLVEAVQPSSAEILQLKAALIGKLEVGAQSTDELVSGTLQELGIPLELHRPEVYNVPPDVDPQGRIDADAIPLRRVRLQYAAKLAIAELVAEGVIVPVSSRSNDYLSVPIRFRGTTGGERVDATTPQLDGAYARTPGKARLTDPPLMDSSHYMRGLEDLLDDRARRCLDEAIASARRGLYLSAVNLLGAVSEAAWYRIGEAIGDDEELAKALAENRTAQVQRLVVKRFRADRRARAMASDLHAHAAFLRDLRNYGVHPRQDQDPGQEQAFTEVGCLLLVMQTHRYLARLRDAAELVGVALPSSTASP